MFLEDCESITLADIKTSHRTKKAVFRFFPDLDIRTVSWIADPFKCEIAMTRSQFESKPNLPSFWMLKAAKAFKIAHEEAVKKTTAI